MLISLNHEKLALMYFSWKMNLLSLITSMNILSHFLLLLNISSSIIPLELQIFMVNVCRTHYLSILKIEKKTRKNVTKKFSHLLFYLNIFYICLLGYEQKHLLCSQIYRKEFIIRCFYLPSPT